MNRVMQGVLGGGMALALAAGLAGCGQAGQSELQTGTEISVQNQAMFVSPLPVASQEALRLTTYWAVERYLLDGTRGTIWLDPRLATSVVDRAVVDECLVSAGDPITFEAAVNGTCPEGATPKRNQAYVWGLTETEGSLWFGTVANTLCLVLNGYLGLEDPILNELYYCANGPEGGLPKDWRPPELHRYDVATGADVSLDAQLTAEAEALRMRTTGFRAAGNAGGVVFIAGPALTGGLNFFAFDAKTGTLLGAYNDARYNDIRTFVRHGNDLYVGVGNAEVPDATSPGGTILRWTGCADPAHVFDFEVVGELPTEAANMTFHEGRLYVTTWPLTLSFASGNQSRVIGLYRSPKVKGALTAEARTQWEKVWSITDYDPDPVAAAASAGGAIASYNGKLYWGTMHVPFLAAESAVRALGTKGLDANGNGALDQDEIVATVLGTHRSIALFEASGLEGKNGTIRLLYGERFLPRYDASKKSYTIRTDTAHQGAKRYVPVSGASGIGTFFNAYVWSMNVFQDQLYIGTFDWTQVATSMIDSVDSQQSLAFQGLIAILSRLQPRPGADVYRIGPNGRLVAETLDGFGNDTAYGIRNMQSDDRYIWIGTANPMNLSPKGGWALLQGAQRP